MGWQLVDRIQVGFPQRSNAGGPIVLVQRQEPDGCKRRLVWFRAVGLINGGTGTVINSGSSRPGRLVLVCDGRETTTLHSGGNLSAQLVKRYSSQINEFFGETVAGQVKIRQTLEWVAEPESKPEPTPDEAVEAAQAVTRVGKILARLMSDSEGERAAAANAFREMAVKNGWGPHEFLVVPPKPGGPDITELEPLDRDHPLYPEKRRIWSVGMHAMCSAMAEADRRYAEMKRLAEAERDGYRQRADQAEAERDTLQAASRAAQAEATIKAPEPPTMATLINAEAAALLLAASSDPGLQARVINHLDAATILDLIKAGPPAGLGDTLVAAYLGRLEGGQEAAPVAAPAVVEAKPAPLAEPPQGLDAARGRAAGPEQAAHSRQPAGCYDVKAAVNAVIQAVGQPPRSGKREWVTRLNRAMAEQRRAIWAGGVPPHRAGGQFGRLSQLVGERLGVRIDHNAVKALAANAAEQAAGSP